MVIYDGERLCVQMTRGKNYKVVLNIAKESEYSEYLSDVGIYCLPPTKKNARTLYEAGYPFDQSAMIFIKKEKSKTNKSVTEIKNKYEIPEELFPFQKEGVQRMLDMNSNILLADEMGLGKTPQASVFLKLKENSLPALVICPASLKQNWQNEIKKWAGFNSHILSGRNPEYYSEEFVEKYPVFIINYDILGQENKEEKEQEMIRRKKAKAAGLPFRKKTIAVHGWCDELSKIPFNTIIADEVQYIAEPETIRARAVQQVCKARKKAIKLFISGTPYETRTSQFFTCLNILNKEEFPNRYKFLMRYCNPVKTFFGWKFDGLSNGEELHEMVSKFMIRRLKKDVLTQLPPKVRAIIPMTVSPAQRQLYDQIDQQFEQDILSGKKDKSEQLGHIAHLKKGAYQAKEKAVIDWIKEYLELSTNKKLVIFIYHHSTYESLMKVFGNKAVGITGETSPDKRQDIVDQFQNNEKIELFIGQIKAAGVGLTLTKASATCFVEFGTSYPQHVQAEDRVHRIGQTADSVMAYYLILDNSIENDIMETINKRANGIQQVLNGSNDENFFESESDMKTDILKNYKTRKNIKK